MTNIGTIRQDRVTCTYIDISDVEAAREAAYSMLNANSTNDKPCIIEEWTWYNKAQQLCYKLECTYN